MDSTFDDRRQEVDRLLADLADWARSHDDVAAVALVGSYAQGEARTSSDVDVVVLSTDHAALADDVAWFRRVRPGSALVRSARWGPVLERRFRLTSGLVVELGLAPPAWADLPLDAGTRRVLRDGHRIVHDPQGRLHRAGAASRIGTR